MSKLDHAGAWNEFWAGNAKGGGGGCLPQAWQSIHRAQMEAWRTFATGLPKRAQVLDLATGDARVLAGMLAVRPDLKTIGTDLAPKLPAPPKGVKLSVGVAMEDLPFTDDRFDAVTSQFGFEYGDAERIAGEMSRVLAPEGRAAIMLHRGDGPILAHNLKRRDAIRWAIEEQELVAKAKQSLGLRALGQTGVPPLLAQAPAEGARQFGARSAAWEIAEAVRQTLVMGARDSVAGVSATLDRIAKQARNELGRIASLEGACATADDGDMLAAAFDKAGLEETESRPIAEPGKAPFATFRLLRHA